MQLVIATNNKKKKSELMAILSSLDFEVLSLSDLNITADPEETGNTFEENALIKAKTICGICGRITVADDSGLEVEALGNAPGIYSARFSGEGINGEGATDEKNIIKLLDLMKNEKNRKARFVSCIACVFPNGHSFCTRGICEGEITYAPSGKGGFGYDPVFYVKEYDRTFAQLSPEEKNKISHRGNALRLFSKELTKRLKKENI